MGCRLFPCHPYQLFLPHDLTAREIIHPRHHGDVDLAALHASDEGGR